jgi:hypothetical protein
MTTEEGNSNPAPSHPDWPNPACEYDPGGYDAGWEFVVDHAPWQSREIGGEKDWFKQLPCPRCGHPMDVFVGPGAFRDAKSQGVPATCTCAPTHKDRADGDRGCGYGAWITAPGGQ